MDFEYFRCYFGVYSEIRDFVQVDTPMSKGKKKDGKIGFWGGGSLNKIGGERRNVYSSSYRFIFRHRDTRSIPMIFAARVLFPSHFCMTH